MWAFKVCMLDGIGRGSRIRYRVPPALIYYHRLFYIYLWGFYLLCLFIQKILYHLKFYIPVNVYWVHRHMVQRNAHEITNARVPAPGDCLEWSDL